MIKRTEFQLPDGQEMDLTEDLRLEVGGEPKKQPIPQSPPTHLLVNVPPAKTLKDRILRAWNFSRYTLSGKTASFFLPIGCTVPYWTYRKTAEIPEKPE